MSMVAWLARGKVEETGSRRFSANVPLLRRGVVTDVHAREILVTAQVLSSLRLSPLRRMTAAEPAKTDSQQSRSDLPVLYVGA